MTAAVVSRENQILRRFMKLNAVNTHSAIPLDGLGLPSWKLNGVVIRRMLRRGLLIDAGSGKYYASLDRISVRQRYGWSIFAATMAVLCVVLLLGL